MTWVLCSSSPHYFKERYKQLHFHSAVLHQDPDKGHVSCSMPPGKDVERTMEGLVAAPLLYFLNELLLHDNNIRDTLDSKQEQLESKLDGKNN